MGGQLQQRTATAELIREAAQRVASSTTQLFYDRHPDWVQRFGARGRRLSIEDAVFHQQFLAAAIEIGSLEPFLDYVRWTRRVLEPRGISVGFLREALDDIRVALYECLPAQDSNTPSVYLKEAVQALQARTGPSDKPNADNPLALEESVYVQAILQGNRKAALAVAFESLRKNPDVIDTYVHVLQSAMYEVGRRWEANRITVAEEHMATAITQYVLSQLYARLEPSGTQRGKAVITGVQGELHQVGANIVADALEADGWDVRFLGTNTPPAGVLQAIDQHGATLFGISATMLFSVPAVISLVSQVKERMGARCPKILLGGSAFRASPQLIEEVGVEGWAGDVRTAIALARSLQLHPSK
jgi:methanogenic corrinoid protein MtbC1